jgi:hypothetical protein
VSCFEFELVNGPETNGREGSFDLWKIGAHSYMTCKGGPRIHGRKDKRLPERPHAGFDKIVRMWQCSPNLRPIWVW